MARNLMAKLPKYYQSSNVMITLMSTDADMLDAAEKLLDDTDAQCLISTADTSLSRWEQIYGLANSEESDERRRERLLARKRGNGTGTIAHLKSVISAFSNGDVEITELYDQYMITIEFVGVLGVPPYLDDVTAAIDEIIPAHIGYTIIIAYRTWTDNSLKTWEEVASKTWVEIAEEEI